MIKLGMQIARFPDVLHWWLSIWVEDHKNRIAWRPKSDKEACKSCMSHGYVLYKKEKL